MIEIELEGLKKTFGSGASAVAAVDDVSLRIASGELFFLLGPSGCGKTTLLRIIAGLIAPDAGEVRFDGRDVTNLPVEKRDTAMVFQNYALWPHMTVAQNVEFGPKMRGLGRRERRELARANLVRVKMESLTARRPNELSGGQQQRVAVARALAARPNCLLLDEPLSNLDARLRMHMRGELRRLMKESGTTAVYVTHDQKEALSMADRIAVMDAGRIVQTAPPQELYDRPATRFVADFLGEANFIDGKVASVGEVVSVETPAGIVRVGAVQGLQQGQNVTCCVRPERVRLGATQVPSGSGGTVLKARVEQTVYLGDIRQCLCRVSGSGVWRVSILAGRTPALAPGTEVLLEIDPADVTVLPVE